MAKVLILKLGYSETLSDDVSKVPGLGDVLRTTVVLNLFKDCLVTWLVDKAAYPLLENNKSISRILNYNTESIRQIKQEQFDTLINFEKDRQICTLAESIKARKRYGFKFNQTAAKIECYGRSKVATKICNNADLKKNNKKCWQDILMRMAGGEWSGQEYILGYKPKTKTKYDVGLNWAVGNKWPNKAWPSEYWEELAKLIEGHHTYSWQRGLNSLYEYIDWINSCRLIVTADSLGKHIALALKKKVLILYGPTNPNETYLYGLGKELLPSVDYSCIPCMKNRCLQGKSCMYFISPQRVANEIKKFINKKSSDKVIYGRF